MITSDTQLESTKPVPAGEVPKDDLMVNSHPANGSGAPVLDGELHPTERPNVNAMREALETQSEMEVGKDVSTKQEEIKTEGKEVTVEKGSGTQIIINIAGKNKTMNFSNRATASAFIKGASAKFGTKFKLVTASAITMKPGDNIAWKLNQFSHESRQGVVIDVLPQNDDGLVIFDAKQEDLGGTSKGDVWGYMGLVYEINGQQVKPVNPEAAEFEIIQSKTGAVTSGMSDIDSGAPSFRDSARGYVIAVGNRWVTKDFTGNLMLTTSLRNAYKYDSFDGGAEAKQDAAIVKNGIANGQGVQIVPTASLPSLVNKEGSMKEAGFNFSPSNVPSQVVQEFYPELQHELISYPNVTNAPMVNPEISGDAHELGTAPAEGIGEAILQGLDIDNGSGEDELLPGAIEDAFDQLSIVGYVSTSPAGGAMGRDGKPQILEGTPLRKELDVRCPGFMEEFYAQYEGIPGNALAIQAAAFKTAGADDKKQFALFLKRVMGEVAASFISAFKVTNRMPMNKVPGVGEINLSQIEQPSNTAFNIVNTGSRVKYLVDKLSDSDLQDCINGAFAQGAVWCDDKNDQEGSYVFEIFVRAETLDNENLILTYKFVSGTKEAE